MGKRDHPTTQAPGKPFPGAAARKLATPPYTSSLFLTRPHLLSARGCGPYLPASPADLLNCVPPLRRPARRRNLVKCSDDSWRGGSVQAHPATAAWSRTQPRSSCCRERRSAGTGGILPARAGGDGGLDPGEADDLACELEPGRRSVVDHMVEPPRRAALRQHPQEDARDIGGGGRGHGLVGDDPERSLLPPDADHGGDFVFRLVHRLQAVALTRNVEVQAAEDAADRPRRRDVQPVAPQWTYLERLSG